METWPGRATLNSQAAEFRRLNRIAWSDASIGTPSRNPSMEALIEGWYGGPPFFGTTFDGDGPFSDLWYNANLRNGAVCTPALRSIRPSVICCSPSDSCTENVYAPFCRACHATQGPNADLNVNFDVIDWRTHDWPAGRSFGAGAVFHDQALLPGVRSGAIRRNHRLTASP